MNETTFLLDTKRKSTPLFEEEEEEVSISTTNADASKGHGTFRSSTSDNSNDNYRSNRFSSVTMMMTDRNYSNNINDIDEEMDQFVIATDNRIIPFYLSLFSSSASEFRTDNNVTTTTTRSKIIHVRAKYMNILMSIVLFTVWIISCSLVALQNHHHQSTTATTRNNINRQQKTESVSSSSVPSSSDSIGATTTTTTTTSQNNHRPTILSIDEQMDQWDIWKSAWDDNPLRVQLVTSSFLNINTTPSWFSTIWNRTNQEAHAVWQNITSSIQQNNNNNNADNNYDTTTKNKKQQEQQWFNTTLWNAYKFYTNLQNTTENILSNITTTTLTTSNHNNEQQHHDHHVLLHDLFQGDTILRFWWNVTQEVQNEINGPSSSTSPSSSSSSYPKSSFSNVTTIITNGTNETTIDTTTTIFVQDVDSSNGTGNFLNRTSEVLPPLRQQQQDSAKPQQPKKQKQQKRLPQQQQQQVPTLQQQQQQQQQQQKGPIIFSKNTIRASILGTFPDEPEPTTTGGTNSTTTIDTTVRNLWFEVQRWVTTEFDEIREQIKTVSNGTTDETTNIDTFYNASETPVPSSSQQLTPSYNIYMNTTRAYAMLQNGILHKWFDYSSDYFTITMGGWDVQMNQAYCGVASATAILNSYKNTIHLPPGTLTTTTTTTPNFGNNMDSPDIEMSVFPSGRFGGDGSSNDNNVDNVLDFQLPIDKTFEPYRYATQQQILSATNECVQSTVIHHNETFDGVRNVPGGLALYQVKRLLECHFEQALYGAPNGVSYHVALQYVDPHSISIETFRDELKRALRDPLKRVIINYIRSEIHQDGGGHYSPLGSYSEEYDRFLILDVAKYKYPPVWVPTIDLYQSLATIDNCGVWDYPDAQDRILSSLNYTRNDLFNNLDLYYALLQQVGCRPTYRGYIITDIILPKSK